MEDNVVQWESHLYIFFILYTRVNESISSLHSSQLIAFFFFYSKIYILFRYLSYLIVILLQAFRNAGCNISFSDE